MLPVTGDLIRAITGTDDNGPYQDSLSDLALVIPPPSRRLVQPRCCPNLAAVSPHRDRLSSNSGRLELLLRI
ncbi:hypothetical protein D8S78_03170 [Natrialba swarupiae]|nr:hypothetical protein [Natrialba swarupiae]